MNISAEEVRHVAQLARLSLNEQGVREMSATLSAILSYMETLNALDTRDVPPTDYIGEREPVLRADVVGASLPVDAALQNAPDRAGAFYRVPKIIE